MKKNTTKNILEVLENSGLSRIVKQANRLSYLNSSIKQILPTQYQDLYRIVNLYDNLLVIDVQNAVVRQGLLLQQQYLLQLIQRDFPKITALEIKVNPDFSPFNKFSK
ncbi:hypothetical protein BMT54_04570 [Pasteurellaceae bacterium 15-036681]|nr:hypothetical protein BMT54_04570 [Pasteurellaceae bacterium 15-036681]